MAISAVGEGCHKQMEILLPQIMEGVIQYLQDPVSILIKYMYINQIFFMLHSKFTFCCLITVIKCCRGKLYIYI